jgi:sugar phosphate isomerase/epimerase
MRLGGPVFKSFDEPEGWIAALKHHDYTAAFSPIRDAEDSDLVKAYAKAAEENDIVIAEVPAFGNNPISPDDATRKQGIEMMPWMIPDSADSNLKLLKAIDRPQLAVHFDPVNIVNSPRRYFNTGVLIKECFDKLGPHIKSCHAKDILMHDKLTVHLDEVRPGLGNLDYATFLTELNKLAPDTPLMLEHLKGEEPYTQAAAYVRGVAEETGVEIR